MRRAARVAVLLLALRPRGANPAAAQPPPGLLELEVTGAGRVLGAAVPGGAAGAALAGAPAGPPGRARLARRQLVRVAVVGGGPAGAASALLLAGVGGLRVDAFERHSVRECWERRGYWVSQLDQQDVLALGLRPGEQRALAADCDATIKAIPYCRLGERLLGLAQRRSGGEGFALHRPADFLASDARRFDWVLLADGAGSPLRERLLPSTPQLLTPLKSAAAVFYPDFPDVRGLDARLVAALKKYRCFWQTDGDERHGRRMVLLPHLRRKKSRRTLYMWFSPRRPVPEELYGQWSVRDFLRRAPSGAEDLLHDVALLDRQARRASPGARGFVSLYRMREAAYAEAAGAEAHGARLLLVGEAAWARDAPFDGQSIPQALRQAAAAAAAVKAGDPSSYQQLIGQKLAERSRELALLRRDADRGALVRHIDGGDGGEEPSDDADGKGAA
ncbi:unnamed protein product [Prorocentrum cordatum]|uniref:Uncharacterized protein n=1 Tax=Prorocentrum cordatum TaxID=2364126 RepID=A0ABN9R3J6_9DINO|nr:unnamed protein product [Polarella glacialis]